MSWTFRDAIPPIGSITEGPVWNGTALLFTNIAMNRILRFDTESRLLSVERTGTNGANGLNYDAAGNLFACEGWGRRLARYDPSGMSVTIVDRLDGRRINGPNDLAIDPEGRIWFSDRAGDVNPEVGVEHSSILCAIPDGDGAYRCVRRTFDTTMPNGLLFSADYTTLYVAQSDYRVIERRELRAYPVLDDGSLGEYAVLHDFGPHRGIDGMTLSSDGLIVACTGWEVSGPGGAVTIFEPDGRIVETHPPLSLRPTNCCFAGTDLYVTSIEGRLEVAENTGLTGSVLFP